MEFIGKTGWAAPRLKDVALSLDKLREGYVELLFTLFYNNLFLWMITSMRVLYQKCKLVHGDLSEYNIVYHEWQGHMYIIDVSQSVDLDHPHAFDFLREDCVHIYLVGLTKENKEVLVLLIQVARILVYYELASGSKTKVAVGRVFQSDYIKLPFQ